MRHKFLIILLLSYVSIFGQSLTDVQEPKIIPPSPDAFTFSTYGNIPVNGSTGGFSYSVPLFQLTEGDISITTSLDYYSNGVLIDKVSSIVGMDWNLTAGGVISRVVRDDPDELAQFRWYPSSVDPAVDYENIKRAGEDITGNFDTEPDWFSFNVNGLSGSFYLDENLGIIINSEQSLKIIYDTQLRSFEIIDEQGYHYFFGGTDEYIERNISSTSCNPIRTEYNSAWFLSEILSPTKNSIYFDYRSNALKYPTAISNSIILDEDCYCSSSETVARSFNYTNVKCVTYNNLESRSISEIRSSNGKIIFDYIEGRTDVEEVYNSPYLNGISLYHKNELIDRYQLHYEFTESSRHRDNDLKNTSSIQRRFFLTSIDRIGKLNKKILWYQFEYQDKDLLPCRLSYSKDIYGYYNASNNTRPFANPKDPSAYYWVDRYASNQIGANREVHPSKVSTGVLTKIIYPTGGSSSIDYEANSDAGMFPEEIEETGTISLVKDECDPLPTTGNPKNTFRFVSNGSPINYSAAASINTMICNSSEDDIHDKYWVSIRNLTTGEMIRSFGSKAGTSVSTDANLDCRSINNFQHLKSPVCTTAGQEYEITFEVGSKFSYISGRIDFRYNASQISVEKPFYGGGARIKSVVDVDNSEKFNNRKFYYQDIEKFPSKNTTLNKLIDPKYSYVSITTKDCGCGLQSPYKYRIVTTAGSVESLYGNRNPRSYYTIITEIIENELEKLGSKVTEYFVVNDEEPSVVQPPFIPNVPYSNNGAKNTDKVKNISYYNKLGQIVKGTTFAYEVLEEHFIPGWSITQYHSFTDIAASPENVTNIAISSYKNYGTKNKLASKTETTYYPEVSSVTTNYTYNPNHYLISETSVTNSLGEAVKTQFWYPDDITSINDVEPPLSDQAYLAIQKMQNNGVERQVGIPVQTKKQLNNSKVIQRTDFTSWQGQFIAPQSISTQKGGFDPEERLVYHRYDERGNPVEVSKADGTSIIYIWGYQKRLPIAQIVNASYAAVQPFLEELQDISNADTDRTIGVLGKEGALRELLDQLRNDLSEAMVTTYTHDPLIGMTSITDPRGYTTYYEYDEFNRLQSVRDADGHLLSQHTYEYKK